MLGLFVLAGLYTLQPNEAVILQLFGSYRGSSRVPGLRGTNPFYSRRKISLRARNLNGERLKVNDKRGNPIEIAAVVVWRVDDTARASFDVDNYENYVKLQSEAAVRHLASSFAYDHADTLSVSAPEPTLLASADSVSRALWSSCSSGWTRPASSSRRRA
jgi:regulator of protease activity HflC (stomatin/prohibitin superfamily)